MRNLWVKAVRLLERGESFVLATVIRTRGSTPRKAGSRMIVCRNGDIVGSLGGGCVEGDVWSAATEMLKRGNPATRKQYHLNEPVESPHGMICGGTMEFLLEPVDRPDEFFPIARAVLAATGAEHYNVLQNNGESAHQAVPHVHFHIIPRLGEQGLGIQWNSTELEDADGLIERMHKALATDESASR